MKKLLIHIGYPKAASTSLQNSLFLDLHNLGLINFMGRAFESNFFGGADSKKEFQDRLKLINSENYPADPPNSKSTSVPFSELSHEKFNVFSEGAFILDDRFEKEFVMPGRIHNYFREVADKMGVLVIIRNQASLIMSNYVQRYRKIEEKTLGDYLDAHIKGPKKGIGDFKVYNLYNLISEYSRVFGKDNIHILLFEDFVQDRKEFVAGLSQVLEADPKTIHDSLGSAHLNKTRKKQGFHYPKKLTNINSFRLTLGRSLLKMGIHWRFLLQYKIPAITDEEKKLVFETFKESNQRLSREFSLDENRMKKYGYF